MPPLAPVAGVAKIECQGTIGGAPWVNIFHAKISVDFQIQADVQALANAVSLSYQQRFLPRMANAAVLNSVTVTDISTDVGPVAVVSGSFAGVVTSSQSSPANVALCVGWSIARHYRGGHPRTYFTGIPSGVVSNPNTISAPEVALWVTAANNFKADIAATVLASGKTYHMVCVHRVKNKVVLPDPLVDDIVGVNVDSRIDSMRRRLGRDR